MPVSQGLKIGSDTELLIKAVQEEKIINSPVERLKEVLRLAMVKVGLRAANFPSDEEKAVLLSHIIDNYGGHTAKEISIAFDMAIAGKLDLEHDEVVCYENFSCLYFSTIMNAYRKWAAQAYKENIKQVTMIEHQEDMSDKAMQDWFDNTAKDYREKKIKIEFLPPMLYDWLRKKELVPDSKEYHVAAAKMIGKRLKEGVDKDTIKEFQSFKAMWTSGCFTGKYVKEIEALSKSIVLNNYILQIL